MKPTRARNTNSEAKKPEHVLRPAIPNIIMQAYQNISKPNPIPEHNLFCKHIYMQAYIYLDIINYANIIEYILLKMYLSWYDTLN